MTLTFNYGFSIRKMNFGNHKTGLYRLPSFIGKRFYPLKKLAKIKLNGQIGYRCYRDFCSLEKIDCLLKKIKQVKVESKNKLK